MPKNKVSHNVVLRLPRYLRYLEELRVRNVVRISSGELGQLMGITASQIRQDLSCFGGFGQQGYGYNVDMLIKEVSDILGIRHERTAIVIGAGNLGRAIIGKFPFQQYGFRLTGAYDLAENLIGEQIGPVAIRHMNQLATDLQSAPPDIAVLTMSSNSADAIAEQLIAAGVRGLWNFTNVDLTVSNPNVVVENLPFSDSLLTLNYYMTHGTNRDSTDK
ncbi:MAG: redox-sensing transcriptional repressor Rex [Oscillospiraceae bacterium]|nr:redox-sensing transcriptional repressor Rex [Oscillospiraceae bacterium]